MMVMEGSKMFKTEYDLKAIMYSAYGTPYKLCEVRDFVLGVCCYVDGTHTSWLYFT